MGVLTLIPFVYAKFSIFILVFTRISALFSTFILFKRQYVNTRILVSLCSILSFYVVMLDQKSYFNYDSLSIQMLTQVLFQFVIGFIAGLVLNIIFDIFSGFGQVVSSQIGLNVASLIDPTLGNITTLTQFYLIVVMLLFLLLNGHLFIIKTIIDSFAVIPLGMTFIPKNMIHDVLQYSEVIFVGSILLSITITVTIFIVNFTLAVMTKFAPQFNIFSIGISMTLIIGLICLYSMFHTFTNQGNEKIQEGLNHLVHTLKLK